MADKKLFLLDAMALIYRAHFAFIGRPLINSKGMNTSAATGFTNSLWDVISKEKPTHIAVAFDLSGPTFRHEMYEPYKANRDAQPEDITANIPYVKKIIEGFNIPVLAVEGYEADDVIGTIAKKAEKEGFEVYMVTPDKDYAQVVSENIYLYKPARSGNAVQILGVEEVLEKWDIQKIEQVIDVLGLQGDAVDNIPGIPGVGAKTAVKLLKQYDSVEKIIENASSIKGKLGEKIRDNAEQGLLSKKLATIDLEVPIEFDAEHCHINEINKEALAEIFKELEFRTIARRILENDKDIRVKGQTDLFGNPVAAPTKANFTSTKASFAEKNINNIEHDYQLVDTPEKRATLIKLLSEQKAFAFDTETTGLDANEAELVGISFSVKAHEGFYVPIPEDQKVAMAIVAEFKEVMENENIRKIGQNVKYDVIILQWYNVFVKGPLLDTLIVHYLLEPEKRHNMNYLAETYLGYSPVSIETLIGRKGKNQLNMRDVPMDKASKYAAEDADITLQLSQKLEPLMLDGIDKLYWEVEEPLIKVLVKMETNGVRIDSDFLNEYAEVLEKDIQTSEKEVYEEVGVQFNMDSPRQVGEILFDRLKLPYRWRKTKSGQYSTNEEKLTEMAEKSPVVAKILEHRGLTKLKSTYVDALPRLVNPKTNRIHSSFNQALAATGRLSSQNPNLQNIPIRTERGRQVRKAFIPADENHILLAADYSQIELRLIAEISGDPNMVEAFQQGLDIHAATASKIYGVAIEEVTREQRYAAKTVNFSIIYGAGATNLSKQLGIKRAEATELIKQYFAQYNGLKNYMEDVVAKAQELGYVTTLKGRRRFLRDINSRNGFIRSQAERNAINTPIQGSAADLIKVAMINIHNALEEKNFKTKMIMQVHDELVFDVPVDELEMVKPIIEDKMKNAFPDLKVPILVGMDVGKDWLEAH